MATAHLTDADMRIRDAVMTQLDWDPEIDASAVGVTARDGTVTLTGWFALIAPTDSETRLTCERKCDESVHANVQFPADAHVDAHVQAVAKRRSHTSSRRECALA